MEGQCQIDPTHIHELPKDLAQNILMRLPIQDAVRTSILSRKWRYIWTEIPQLVFDDKCCKESIMKTKNKLIKVINQVILLHQGPLNKFELSASSLKSSSPKIDLFVLVVLRKGVKDLTLCFQKDEPYRLPLSVFSYGEQLTRLKLVSCVFKPPSGFKGFNKLEKLMLDEVVGINGSGFSSIFSHCPVLESLDFASSTRCSPIEIAAPKLKYLMIKGPCQPLCFKDTPELVTAKIYSGHVRDSTLIEIEASSQFILCGRLPGVKDLYLDSCYTEYLASNRASTLLANDLCHVKKLSLFDICFGIFENVDEVSPALCLIRNSQNLEEFKITVYSPKSATEVDLAEAEDVSLDYLKKVELRKVSGSKCELQFIKLILAGSPLLEKFIIIPDSNYLVGEKESKFLKELLRFRRASTLVEISYEG